MWRVWSVVCCWQVSAVESLEGPLLQVEGLSDLRLELHSRKLNIHLVLIDELHRHLYIKSTSRVGHRGKDKDKARLGGWARAPNSDQPFNCAVKAFTKVLAALREPQRVINSN